MATLYISPLGAGLRDGSSAANAGTLSDLPAFVAAAGADGKVLLIADQGAYRIGSEVLSIVNGGTAGHPVTIGGIDSDGNPARAEIIGRRADPYVANSSPADEVFRLLEGADNLVFTDLSFKNIGYAAIRVGGDIENLRIEHVDADNVQRFLEDYASGDAKSATISGLTVRDVQVDGFSKGVIRLQYDTHDVLIQDVRGDSQRQNGENFAMGVHLGGTVHDVVFQRVTMRNSYDSVSGAYWNGDGFATEKDVHGVLFEDTVATGSTDAGYDLKSSDTTLIRAIAEGNGRNFRIWGTDVVITDAISLDPVIRGGTATQYHFGFMRESQVTLIRPYVSDNSSRTTAFDANEVRATVTVVDPSITLNPGATLMKRAFGAVVTITGSDSGIAVSGGGTADFSADTAGLYVHADELDQLIIGGSGNDILDGGAGHDALVGGEGDDRLHGGAGDDVLDGGAGADVLLGGTGFDLADYGSASSGVQVDLVSGAPGGGAAGDLLDGIEGLIGSAHSDTLRGDGGDNLLVGGEGDDVLDGRAGADILVGGAGADTLIGGAGIDMADYSASATGVEVDLAAGTGSGGDAEGDTLSGIEVVLGSAHADILRGGDGDDLLQGGAGADRIIGGGGIDTVDFGYQSQAVSIDLTTGESHGGDAEGDQFSEIEMFYGTAFDDTLIGDAGENVFFGGEGADRLDGADGDDRLIGGAGADILIGGEGIDTADYSGGASAVSVDLAAGVAAGGDAEGDTLSGIEIVIGTAFDDSLAGRDADERLEGGAGNDLLIGGGGADILVGGAGLDTVSYASSLSGIVLDLAAGTGTGDAAGDVLSGVEIVIGSNHADELKIGAGVLVLDGAGGDDTLTGDAGADLLIGGAGADTMDGGAGIDTADYSGSAEGVTVFLSGESGSGGDAEGDILRSIERLIGSHAADSLHGDALDNILIGGAGADGLFGGEGIDTADYSASAAGVSVDLAAGTGTGGDAEGDTLAGIEVLVGSAHADTLTGSDADERFVGGAGADAIVGGGGRDLADYSASAAPVTVNLATGLGSGGDAAGDTLSGIEDVIGTAGDDALTGDGNANRLEGGAGKDTLDGGGGDDILIGGAGDDLYVVDSLDDVVVEEAGGGSDRVSTALAEYTLGANVEGLTYTGTGSFLGLGNTLANGFVGSAGSETFYGFEGNDRMAGSLGADTFYGGAGVNAADYSKSKAAITLNLTTNVNLGGDAEGDVLYDVAQVSGSDYSDSITGSSGAETFYGRGGADALYGLDGDDYLDGGAGTDWLEGGNGNDSYVVDVLTDQVIEAADAGIDTVRTTLASYTLGENVENLIHTGTRSFTGIGNALDNQISGASVGDQLFGGEGNDVLIGRGGADRLDGGEGNDTASYALSALGVVADLSAGVGLAGEAQGDSYVSIENLVGSARADRLTGDDNANRLEGGGDADQLSGGGGADILIGGAGDDLILGGAELDTAVFSGALADYAFSLVDGAIVVSDLRLGAPDGTDTVREVETFVFADGPVSEGALIELILARPPDDISLSGDSFAEDAPGGTVIGTALGHDAPGTIFTYSLADDAGGRFTIDPLSGVLSTAPDAVFDHESEPSVAVTIVVSDAGGLTYSETFSLSVSDVNEAPTELTLAGGSVAETAGGGVVVGTVSGIDPDAGETLHYTLIDDAGGRFAIDAATGVVTTVAGAVFDHETAPTLSLGVRVEDAQGLSLTRSFEIAVADVNEAPTELVLSNSPIPADAAPGTLVGTATGTDPDGGDSLSYRLVDAAGGRFSIDPASGELRVAAGAVLAPGSYEVGIEVRDAAGASLTRSFTLAVEAPDPFKGDSPDLASNSFIVDTRPGGVSGALSIVNFGGKDLLVTTNKIPDSNNDGIIVFGQGGVLNLTPAKITVTAPDNSRVTSLEYDGKVVHDGVDYYVYSRLGSVAGTSDVRFPAASGAIPTGLALIGSLVAENAAGGTQVGVASGSDPEPGAVLTYALIDDAGGRFAIDPVTGALSVVPGAMLDFETLTSHPIVVSVTNAHGGSLRQGFTVAVADVNEAPIVVSAIGATIAEGSGPGTVAGSVKGTDPDAGDAVSYMLLDDAGGRFSIDAVTGVLSVAGGPLDFETASSHELLVQITDTHGLSSQQVVSVQLTDRPEVYSGTDGADVFSAMTNENWTVTGGAGDDTLSTEGGADTVTGGAGDDIISTGDGDDIVKVTGRTDGFDTIDGGAGFDQIVATARNAIIGLHSVSGVELITANGLAGVAIRGSAEADILDFSATTLNGITRISGDGGDDTIIGSAGDDVIIGGAGDDRLAGGGGNDVFLFYDLSGRDVIEGGEGYDAIRADRNDSVLVWGTVTGVEEVSAAGFTNVKIVGTAGADVIDLTGIAVSGIRWISGGDGADTITGSAEADLIIGGLGRDELAGGAGADVFDFDAIAEIGLGSTADAIADFVAGVDRVDLSTIDASTRLGGNQAFSFIGDAVFGRVAGQLRVENGDPATTRVQGDVNGDGVADFELVFHGKPALGATDFVL
ncbi:MAG: hypothetical protein DI527_10535 [Chelatococcus sp.]|nr:MAG: hypothetical protein DI527_10535 [Chelatococcus sp.]